MLGRRHRADGDEQGARALGPRRKAHLERGSRADVAFDHDRVERRACEQPGDVVGTWPREVEARVALHAGRAADDAAVGDAQCGRGDLACGGGRNCVDIDVRPFEPTRGDGARLVEGGMGRAHRDDRLGSPDELGERVHVGEARVRGAGSGGVAPPA